MKPALLSVKSNEGSKGRLIIKPKIFSISSYVATVSTFKNYEIFKF